MAIVYTPPGVSVDEVLSPSVQTILADAALVAVVGEASGFQSGTAVTTVAPGNAPIVITAPSQSVFVDNTFTAVFNLLDPTQGQGANNSGYTAGSGGDYTAALSTDKKTLTVTPTDSGDLATNGGTVKFVFKFVPDNYFIPIRLDSQAAIEQRFGPAITDSGIGSPLSFAASKAIENGAATVVCLPLFNQDSEGVRTSATDVTAPAAWQASFASLRDFEDINILVPAPSNGTNNEAIFLAAQNHLATMALQGQYIVTVLGADSSEDTTVATASDLRTWATVLQSSTVAEQIIFVSPSRFTVRLPTSQNTITVGGQYAAAAIAGMIAGRPITASLTRKVLAGFVAVADTRDQSGKNADAANGLLVIEQKGGVLQIRHAITLDTSSAARREIGVVRAKHHMIESLRSTIDSQIIGQTPATSSAPTLVMNTVISVLEDLRSRNELVGYSGVQARIVTNDPTTVEVRFSYQPAFPLNYVHIEFSLDLSAGITDINTTSV